MTDVVWQTDGESAGTIFCRRKIPDGLIFKINHRDFCQVREGNAGRMAICWSLNCKRLTPSYKTWIIWGPMPSFHTIDIALIPGDGIGTEVMPEGVRVLEAAAKKYDLQLNFREFDWSCETYLATGKMMPEDGIELLRPFDAIYLGAAGFPTVPDHISLWGLLIPIRREFDQHINLRPVRLFEGVPCPLANKKPGDIDFYVVRENVEGEYSAIGGVQCPRTVQGRLPVTPCPAD